MRTHFFVIPKFFFILKSTIVGKIMLRFAILRPEKAYSLLGLLEKRFECLIGLLLDR